MEININFKPYKTTYEGSYQNCQFELEIFRDGNWQMIWLEESSHSQETVSYLENEIYQYFTENMTAK